MALLLKRQLRFIFRDIVPNEETEVLALNTWMAGGDTMAWYQGYQ